MNIIGISSIELYKKYHFHMAIFEKYDKLLKEYGCLISIRDTDHTYNSLRWWVVPISECSDIKAVKRLGLQLSTEFYTTCEKCGKRIENTTGYKPYEDSGVFIDDYQILCSHCEAEKEFLHLIGYGNSSFESIIEFYRNCKEKGDDYHSNRSGNIKFKVLTDDNRTTYCRCKDIQLVENNTSFRKDAYMVVPKRLDKIHKGFTKDIPDSIKVPTGYEAVKVEILAYDMGLRDIYGERIYSSDRGCFMYQGEIFGFDAYSIPLGGPLKELKEYTSLPFIVRELTDSNGNYQNPYHMTVDEFKYQLQIASVQKV